MKKFGILVTILFNLGILFSCTKGPGPGGRASIKGKIFARNYNNGYVKVDSGYIGGQKVFIKYGDEPGVGDNVDTDLSGTYVFPYLREGKYTVYAYSKRLLNNTLDTVISATVTIQNRKGVVEAPLLNINTFKN